MLFVLKHNFFIFFLVSRLFRGFIFFMIIFSLFLVEENCTDTAENLVKFTTQFEER